VLVTRPSRSARLYKRIWRKDGSPLFRISEAQVNGLKERMPHANLRIELGMRYGEPSLESAIDKLIEQDCRHIILFPMYPQYSAATSASTYDVVFSHLLKRRWVPTLNVVEPYYKHPAYIKAVAASIHKHLAALNWKPDAVVLSYHGIPRKYIEKGDPYCCNCQETTVKLRQELNLQGIDLIHTYQSRFGRDPWLEPYTDQTIAKLGREKKKIVLACPGFPADCLETLDELGNEGRHQFMEAGGEHFSVVPCLNDMPEWLDAMRKIVAPFSDRLLSQGYASNGIGEKAVGLSG